MKRKNILDALNGIDFDMVEDAEGKHHRAHGALWLRWAAVAACLCLVIAAIIALPIAFRYGRDRWLEIPDDTTGESKDFASESDETATVGSSDTESDKQSGDVDSESGSGESDLPILPQEPIEYVAAWGTKNVDGKNYMIIHDEYEVSKDHNDDVKNFKGIKFYTLDDFKGTIVSKQRKLSRQELDDIATFFDRDENGIPMLDFNDLYIPALDDSWELLDDIIWWNGNDYEFFAVNEDNDVQMSVRIMPKADFEERLSRDNIARSFTEGDKVINIVERVDSTVLYVSQGEACCICTTDKAVVLPFDGSTLMSFGVRRNTVIKYLTCEVDGCLGLKEIIDIELTDMIRKELSLMTETGEIEDMIADGKTMTLEGHPGFPMYVTEAVQGTRWLVVDGIMYRISHGFDQISIVESMYSKGRILEITYNFMTTVKSAMARHPNDRYHGEYQDGVLTLDHVYEGLALVDIKVKDIVIGKEEKPNYYETVDNKIILELSANVPCEYKIAVETQFSVDNLLGSSTQTAHIGYDPVTLEIDFVGSSTSQYYLYIMVGYTTIAIRMLP